MVKDIKQHPTELIRASAAEYLTFIAASGKGGVEAIYADETIWLTQKMMGVLYDVETHTINYHLKTNFSESELQENAVIRTFQKNPDWNSAIEGNSGAVRRKKK